MNEFPFTVVFDVQCEGFFYTETVDLDPTFEIPVGGAMCEGIADEMVEALENGDHVVGRWN